MTGPGRPPIGPVVEVRLPQDQLEAVDKYAEDWGLTRAGAIRHMVAHGIDQLCHDHVER